MAALRDFIVSKVRVKIIKILLENPTEMYYVRDLVRRTGEEINAVRRELSRMDEASMVKKEARGNRLYYWFRTDYPFYSELLSLVAKTTGLGARIRKNKGKIGRLTFVVFSGEFVRRRPKINADQVDILVVGDVVLPELAGLIRQEESVRNHEINYTPMTRDEFEFRKKRRDPFVLGILTSARFMILGDEQEFVS
ncbi:MAG: winged helix-turn-helix transcriptional regulator [Candidatus Blackburnbacteria bacterium]|nr:winged helix-turn-helix transcriptional regulator [Candidatus Blackburnbacteria bacterium]